MTANRLAYALVKDRVLDEEDDPAPVIDMVKDTIILISGLTIGFIAFVLVGGMLLLLCMEEWSRESLDKVPVHDKKLIAASSMMVGVLIGWASTFMWR